MRNEVTGQNHFCESLEPRTLLSVAVAHPFGSKVARPAAPSLLGYYGASATTISLSWQDNSTNEKGFIVSRLVNGRWKALATLRANTAGYTDSGLIPNTYYAYMVQAYNAGGVSAPAFNGNLLTDPGAPSNIAQVASWLNNITLNWIPNPAQAPLQVVQQYSGGNWFTLATLSAADSRYTVNSLSPSTSYAFQVLGEGYSGIFSVSGAFIGDARTASPSVRPAAPDSLNLAGVTANSATFSWADSTGDELGFRLEHSTDGTNWTSDAQFGPTYRNYTVSGLRQGVDYQFRLFAENSYGDSIAPTTTGTVTTPTVSSIPAPSGVTVTSISPTQVIVQLTDNATTEQSYKIESTSDGVNWFANAFVGSGAIGSRLYVVSNLQPGTFYSFRASAVNGTVASSPVIVSTSTLSGPQSSLTLSNGKILKYSSELVAGSPNGAAINQTYGLLLTRYKSDGTTVDTTFGTAGKVTVGTYNGFYGNASQVLYFAARPDGSSMVVEHLGDISAAGANVTRIVSVSTNGTVVGQSNIDDTFSSGSSFLVLDGLSLAPDGKAYIYSHIFNSVLQYTVEIARYTTGATLDSSFNGGIKVLSGFYDLPAGGAGVLPNGLVALTFGNYAVALDASGKTVPPGFDDPANAILSSYAGATHLQFTTDSINETGFILEESNYNAYQAGFNLPTLVPLPQAFSTGYTFSNADQISINQVNELFAVNGSLRTGAMPVQVI